MQALHDDDDRPIGLVEARGDCVLIPRDYVLTHKLRRAFASLVRIVDYDRAAERLPHFGSAIACDRSICAGCIDNAALSRAELVFRFAIVLKRGPRKYRLVFLRLHDRAHLVGVRCCKALGIAGVNELGVRE